VARLPSNPNTTCFIVRRRSHSNESPFCIGAKGKIRLSTIGRSDIELSSAVGRPNTIIVDVVREVGRFKVDFIPDSSDDTLVSIPNGDASFVRISQDGAIAPDDARARILREQVENISLRQEVSPNRTIGNGSWVLTVTHSTDNGLAQRVYRFPKTRKDEANWLSYVLSNHSGFNFTSVKEVYVSETVGKRISIFDDGSICVAPCPSSWPLFFRGAISHLEELPTNPRELYIHPNPKYRALFPAQTYLLKFHKPSSRTKFVEVYQRFISSAPVRPSAPPAPPRNPSNRASPKAPTASVGTAPPQALPAAPILTASPSPPITPPQEIVAPPPPSVSAASSMPQQPQALPPRPQQPPPPPPVIRSPASIQQPALSDREKRRYYPDAAQRGGSASLDCAVSPSGSVTGCRVISESVTGRGIGDAAVRLVENEARGSPARENGRPVFGRATIRVSFVEER
jgi:protein TonB